MFKSRLSRTVRILCFLLALNASCGAYPQWGLSERQGRRSSMEDEAVILALKLNTHVPKAFLFGVFDGHGGSQASKYAAQKIGSAFTMCFNELSPLYSSFDDLIRLSYLVSFNALDQVIKNLYRSDGSTALSALVTPNEVYLSWIGDSRGLVLNADGRIKCSTIDHKPDSPKELARYGNGSILIRQHVVENKSGRSFYKPQRFGQQFHLEQGEKVLDVGPWRLGPLSLSRALGDHEVKNVQPLIIADSETIKVLIEHDDIVILACDGVWDVMSNEDVAKLVTESQELELEKLESLYPELTDDDEQGFEYEDGSDLKMKLVARAIRDKSYELGSGDNLSVLVIKIKK